MTQSGQTFEMVESASDFMYNCRATLLKMDHFVTSKLGGSPSLASTWEGTYDPDTERNHQMLREDIKPLRLYPFVYLIVSIFPLINRIQNAFAPHNHVFALVVLACLSAPLHGALNALVFGMDRETLKKLTPMQIMTALQARVHPQEVREYPLAVGHLDDLEATPDNSKFRHVAYTRLH
ncbi:hypothetical protein C0Q70_20891 [Pomacea canaliculata]|uniref:G protein-coupled receptor GPR1/2/3 C-terminal domain-containing protein n=1 Tax=Pomacea canaliculata TaxID=400727 RepID=A0A2T7NB22_POMCA|nr:hypothetical protein C0Q70_20891 [Pomacea canaliculata]